MTTFTQDEVIEMAREAGLSNPLWIENDYKIIKTFANLVEAKATAKERETCAKLCEQEQEYWGWDKVIDAAKIIRARGEQA